MGRLINWKQEARRLRVTREQWNNIVKSYRKNPDFREVTWTDERRYKRVFWFGVFRIDESDKKYPTLYVGTPSGLLFRFSTNAVDDEKNTPKIGGYEAFRLVSNVFRNNAGVGLEAAFGKVEPVYKKFVKPAIIQIEPRYALQNCYGTYKADFSSAYPAAACGSMPDAHTAITVSGLVRPSKEYPFAFYMKSGHLAEFERFDTHEWIKTFYAKYLKLHNGQTIRDEYDTKVLFVKDEEEKTVLMKASEFSLTKTMEQMYNKRKGDDEIKQSMVAFVGFCQSTRFNHGKFAHISAIVYGRHIQKMIDTTKKLRASGCVPLMWATDSISWRGKPPEGLCAEEKTLGAFVLEYKNAILRYKACGVYALQDLKTGNIYLIKHQGVKLADAEKIRSLRDIDSITLNVTQIKNGEIIERSIENGTGEL